MVRGFLKDDILVMCSDGLSNMVKQDDIYKMAMENIEQAPVELVRKANENGGYDNITVVVIKIYKNNLKKILKFSASYKKSDW